MERDKAEGDLFTLLAGEVILYNSSVSPRAKAHLTALLKMLPRLCSPHVRDNPLVKSLWLIARRTGIAVFNLDLKRAKEQPCGFFEAASHISEILLNYATEIDPSIRETAKRRIKKLFLERTYQGENKALLSSLRKPKAEEITIIALEEILQEQSIVENQGPFGTSRKRALIIREKLESCKKKGEEKQ